MDDLASTTPCAIPTVVAAVTWVEHDGAPAQAVPGPTDVLPLAQREGRAAGDAAPEVGERAQRRRTHLAVDEADAALEVADCSLGVGPEQPVDAPGVEAEAQQALLELRDVVTAGQVAGE